MTPSKPLHKIFTWVSYSMANKLNRFPKDIGKEGVEK
jgi:hypothetical protein